jgi:hypothetical protein
LPAELASLKGWKPPVENPETRKQRIAELETERAQVDAKTFAAWQAHIYDAPSVW